MQSAEGRFYSLPLSLLAGPKRRAAGDVVQVVRLVKVTLLHEGRTREFDPTQRLYVSVLPDRQTACCISALQALQAPGFR